MSSPRSISLIREEEGDGDGEGVEDEGESLREGTGSLIGQGTVPTMIGPDARRAGVHGFARFCA